jgi:hypothetical protein
MKLNDKQIDDIARLLGTLAGAAIIGAIVGYNRPDQVTTQEVRYLAGAALSAVCFALLLRVNKNG